MAFGIVVMFVFSGPAISDLASAGAGGHNPQGPWGNCRFDKETYSVGETMTIIFNADGGNPDKGFFEIDLINPSGVAVIHDEYYVATITADTRTYTVNLAGDWTAELTYNVPARRTMKTTLLSSDVATVPGIENRLTLVQTNYDPSYQTWEGLATLLDNSGIPMAGETVVLQYSSDGGATWRNTRQGSRVTDAAGQAIMNTAGPIGLMLRTLYAAEDIASNVVIVA